MCVHEARRHGRRGRGTAERILLAMEGKSISTAGGTWGYCKVNAEHPALTTLLCDPGSCVHSRQKVWIGVWDTVEGIAAQHSIPQHKCTLERAMARPKEIVNASANTYVYSYVNVNGDNNYQDDIYDDN